MAEIDVLTYGAAKSYTDKHGGGGGTSNYNALENKPQIGGNELVGNKTASDLGLVAAENGKSLSTNDYDNAEKQKNADNATAVSAIKGDIAPNFNATASYAVDDYVLKDGVLYKCTTAHTGAWDANDFTATTISDEITDVADAVDDIKDGTDIDSFGDVETALAGKQDTLTFDDVPTANSSNPVKSGGVYSALADKQDALTAGNYISIANDGTINVTQGIGVYDVYSYEIKSINSGYATKITKRKNGVFVSEQDISNGTYSSENRLNVDDRFEFWYTFAGYLWHYKLLVDSNEHQKDEEVSWEYSTLVDYTETFNVSQDSSTDLATKGDIEAAISSAYHHAGTKTCAELVAGLLVAGNEGNVYNMTDSGTTTADFIEGAGQPIKAGDNVGIAKISDGVYKFDLLSGFVDTTNFVQKSETAGLLKNDGTVDTTIQGDISSLKSGLTNIDNEVNGDAVTYPYADVITIEDAIPANVADCSVKIEPVQSGSGDPSPENVRPITGHAEASVYRVGKNLWTNVVYKNSTAINSSGNEYSVDAYNLYKISVKENTNYVLSLTDTESLSSSQSYRIQFLDASDNALGLESGVYGNIRPNKPFTTPSGTVQVKVSVRKLSSDIQLELGSTATPYTPYAGQTYTIALGDTIYGGTVRIDSNGNTVMDVDRAIDTVGNLSFTKYDVAQGTLFRASISGIKTIQSYDTTTALCSAYKPESSNDRADGTISQAGNATSIDIIDNRYSDVGDFKTAMGSTQICYELATPTTIQLTPTQIQLLKGTNTLTASTGQISVTVNGVSGAIGAVQTQANDTNEALAELAADIAEQLPTAPTTDGAYVLTVTVADGSPTYSWESAT